jgi:alpha-L-fucosidase
MKRTTHEAASWIDRNVPQEHGSIRLNRRDLLKGVAAAALVGPARAQGTAYSANWQSLDQRPTPQWYADSKFGIFIHWGVYSVPAYAPLRVKDETQYAEWYWHSLTAGRAAEQTRKPGSSGSGDGKHTWDFHKRVYGAEFQYQDFAPMFGAELFDPDQWADLFARSGAKYVALTSKHHDGFTLWRSAEANRDWGRAWNAVDIGPKRDLLLDLSEAGRRKGLQMGIYYSLYEWYNPLWLADRKRYAVEHMMPQFKDVVTHARPSIIFSDGEWEMTSDEWHSPELLAWLFNESPVAGEVVINDRWGKDTRHLHGGYFTTEYTAGLQAGRHPWEEDRGMGYSFGYNRIETAADYRTERELVLMLVDIVSRGGNLLLDIGPTGDGRIPVIMQERLMQMGAWLSVNGEAIYGTKPWNESRQWSAGAVPKLEEKQFMGEYDIARLVDAPPAGSARVEAFFTTKGSDVYALLPRWPHAGVELKGLRLQPGATVTAIATGERLTWHPQGAATRVDPPKSQPERASPVYTLKITGAV